MHINCIAIDDEPFALGIIEEYCSRIDFLQLNKTFESGIAAIDYLKTNRVDLIFLDIEMREISGLRLMDIVRPMPLVILTTAYDQYAVKSYEYSVLDYLLKPISFDRFVMSASKALDKLTPQPTAEIHKKSENSNNYIFVKSGYANIQIKFADIHYIEGQRDYLLIRTANEKIMTMQSFSQIEKALPPTEFIRVHRSYMVALSKIEKIERFRLHILDTDIPVGDSYKKGFTKMINEKSI